MNPDTPAHQVVDLIPLVDMMLVMTVHPGFGGQRFIPRTLEKIPQLRQAAGGWKDLEIEVDGGIGLDTILAAARSGANVFVVGSSVFGRQDSGQALRDLRAALTALDG